MPLVETTTTSTTPVSVLSITGSGRLRFLGIGHTSANGQVRLTINVDGNPLITDAPFSGAFGGVVAAPLAVAVVGAITGAANGTTYLAWPVPEEGLEFKSSLSVQAYTTSGGTAYIGTSHRLYR
jgi:hypothetical protein